VKLSDLLLALADLHWLEIEVKDDTVSLEPTPELVGRQNAKEIIIPKLDFRDADLQDCLSYIVHQSTQQKGPNGPRGIGIINNYECDRKVTISLKNVSAWDAVKKVAEAAGGSLIMEGYKLTIIPPR
jgi:hypothetical protein